MKKSSIINWFRYHHYNTNPCLESHHKFMGCLNFLEIKNSIGLSDLANGGNSDDDWKEILNCINSLTEEDLKHLGRLIKTKYK